MSKSARSLSGPLLWTSSTETNYAAFTARHVVQILGAFRHDLCRKNPMKVLFISFVVGLGAGILYGLIRVKSPAPPIVALLGLSGMVIGEQFGIWVQTKKLDVSHAASVCLVGERYARPDRSEAP